MSTAAAIERSWVTIERETRQCAAHGPYEARLDILQPRPSERPWTRNTWRDSTRWSSCPECEAAGQREADARDAEIRGGMTAKQAMAAARVRAAGIPERFAESTLWNWNHGMDQQKTCWNWAREFAGAFDIVLQTGRSGVFLGAPGTGKTHLAIGLLRHVLEKGGTGLYVTVMSMLGRIKDTYNKAATETETAVIEHLTTVDLLVIDEVGRSLDTNYETAQFFRVLDKRYQNVKPTLLVSNLNKEKLVAFLGDAVVDRLREAGGAVRVFDWASQRSVKGPTLVRDEE